MNNMIKPKIIGLTGGIACGKSTVARLLEQQGYSVIDADHLGHRVLEPGHSGFREVVKVFGRNILDTQGSINRSKLGILVFQDQTKLERLNSISHPYIERMIEKEIQKLSSVSPDGLIFLEAALLIEAGWHKRCQSIWVVTADHERILKRITKRNRLSYEEAGQRIKAQISAEDRLTYANEVLYNNGTKKELKLKVDKYLKKLQLSMLNCH